MQSRTKFVKAPSAAVQRVGTVARILGVEIDGVERLVTSFDAELARPEPNDASPDPTTEPGRGERPLAPWPEVVWH